MTRTLSAWPFFTNPQSRSLLAELDGHHGPVTAAEFCAWQSHILISASEDRSFKVWGGRQNVGACECFALYFWFLAAAEREMSEGPLPST